MSVPPNNIEQLVAWNRVNQSALNGSTNLTVFETVSRNIKETEQKCNREIANSKSPESLDKAHAIFQDLQDLKEAFEANELYNIFKASREMLKEAKKL